VLVSGEISQLSDDECYCLAQPGIWLVFLPCAWSISLAVPGGQLPDPKMLTLFALGSFFMRGAGCVINDMWDKDYDSRVSQLFQSQLNYELQFLT